MTEKAKPGRPRNPAFDKTVLDTALALYEDGGAENVTYDQISKRSGISRAAIYRRWPNRDQIHMAALRARTQDPVEIPAEWTQRDFRTRLDWFILQIPKLMMSPFFQRLASEAVGKPGGSINANYLYNEAFHRPHKHAFDLLVQAAIAEDILDEKAPTDLIYDMVYGALINRMLTQLENLDEFELRRYLVGLLTTLGLKAPN